MDKLEIETTDKGFKILSLKTDHVLLLGGLGICDSCCKPAFEGKYIAVLNSYYCQSCFEDWYARAKYYQEDKGYENRRMELTLNLLKTHEVKS